MQYVMVHTNWRYCIKALYDKLRLEQCSDPLSLRQLYTMAQLYVAASISTSMSC